MRYRRLCALLTVLALLMVGCGSDDEPASSPTTAPPTIVTPAGQPGVVATVKTSCADGLDGAVYVCLDTPRAGAALSGEVTVSGFAAGRPGPLTLEVRDSTSRVIAQTSLPLGEGGLPAKWETKLSIPRDARAGAATLTVSFGGTSSASQVTIQ